MKSRPLLFAIALASALPLTANVSAAGPQLVYASLESAPRVNLDHRRARWATDAPLREGMERIRLAVVTFKGVDQPAPRQSLAVALEGNIALIVAQCKLPAEADASLHPLLGELEGAVAGLKSGGAREAALARARAIRVLDEYGRTFDHPGWRSIA